MRTNEEILTIEGGDDAGVWREYALNAMRVAQIEVLHESIRLYRCQNKSYTRNIQEIIFDLLTDLQE